MADVGNVEVNHILTNMGEWATSYFANVDPSWEWEPITNEKTNGGQYRVKLW